MFGFFKRAQARAQREQALLQIAERAGVISRCAVCHGVTETRLSNAQRQQSLEKLFDDCADGRAPDLVEAAAGDCQSLVLAVTALAANAPTLCDCEDL